MDLDKEEVPDVVEVAVWDSVFVVAHHLGLM